MHSVEFTKLAAADLKGMPRNTAATILAKINALAAAPFAVNHNVKKLQGLSGYRLRVGNWRVLYEIENDRLVVLVVAVKPRGGAYQ